MGALDANGIWMYAEGDPADPASVMLNVGQSATSAAIGALKAALGTVVQGTGTTSQSSAAGAAMIYTGASSEVVLPPGTWIVTSTANLLVSGAFAPGAQVALGLWDSTAGAEVPNSRGAMCTPSNSEFRVITTRRTKVVVAPATTKTLRPYVVNNGGTNVYTVSAGTVGPTTATDAWRVQ